jgi:hypothetical protein
MIGQCYNCGCRIGRKTANNIFYYADNMRQVALKYILKREGSPDTEIFIHVPICSKCLSIMTKETIENGLKAEASFKDFKRDYPTAVFDSFTEETEE